MISFVVWGNPVAKGRPRFRRQGEYVKAYTDQRTVNYESLVGIEYVRQCKRFIFPNNAALRIIITAYMPIPRSTSKRETARLMTETVPHTKKPDTDNLAKAVLDGLLGLAYRDDSQISELVAKKYYSLNPRVEVEIDEI